MKYFVESYGCTMNFGEGRRLSADMASLGYSEADSADAADIVILNTCTVVESTEKRMLSRISELKKAGKEVIVTGCMAKAQPQRIEIRLPGSLVLVPSDYHMFAKLVADRYGIAGPPVPATVERTAILPIAQGCRGRCSYCITKIARGELSSYDESMLVGSFRNFVSSGSREVLLTAQDTASYGADTGTDLPSLVRRCLETPGEYRVRIGMMNPDALERCWEGLVATFDDERMYRFLHIPVQSGSDAILRAMRRKYTVDGFMELVDDLRSACPDVSIATDVICGFPGETDGDHAATMDLIRKLRADTVNITRFSPRPGTDAWSMPQVHGRIANERSKEMTALKNETELDVNSAMVGKEYLALCIEEGKEGMVMRTGNYRPVVVREPVEIGDFATVRVTENRATYLIGEIVQK